MGFWIRNIIFGCILATLAYFFFSNQDLLLSFGDDTTASASTPVEKLDTVATAQNIEKAPEETQKKENKAATGLSKFYANINGDPNVKKRTIRNNIVYLPELENDLELLLDARQKNR
ncbi:hypothetical protein [Pseudocolwellia sp. HL-MZ7]|uniref:hypothetical protein n=1 Tax=Pseudocolwellia sp. HL-MZ7 TaxID=3400627 RepID=UPI003CEE1B9F